VSRLASDMCIRPQLLPVLPVLHPLHQRAPLVPHPPQRSSGSYFKILPDFWVSWGGSGGHRGPGKALKNVGADGPHNFEGFPGPRGPPDLPHETQKSGQILK
jgi:hypothetical protein